MQAILHTLLPVEQAEVHADAADAAADAAESDLGLPDQWGQKDQDCDEE
jgi:hypothetical protein